MPTLTHRAPRLDLERPIFLQSAKTQRKLSAKTKNLSESGMLVCTPQPMPVDTHLICSLPLGTARRAVRGRVAWVREDRRAPQMGIEFLDLSHLDREHLQQLLGGEALWALSAHAELPPRALEMKAIEPPAITLSCAEVALRKKARDGVAQPILLRNTRNDATASQRRLLATPPPLPSQRTADLLAREGDWQRPSDSVLTPRNRHPFLLIFVAIMGPVTLAASMIPFDLWSETVEKQALLSSWAAGLQLKLTGRKPLVLQFNTLLKKGQAPPPFAVAPRIERTADRTTLTVRLKGSLANSQQYPLKQPEGIAFDLPRASTALPFGKYRIAEPGFRALWLDQHGVGIRIRVLFDDSLSEGRSTELSERGLIVTLHHR